MREHEIWFDTDFGSDVDDALALFFLIQMKLMAAPPILSAVSTSYGPTEVRARAAQTLLQALNQEQVPVYAGVNELLGSTRDVWTTGREGDGASSEAEIVSLESLTPAINKDFTLLITGPATNNETLFELPAFKDHCIQVVMMGGSLKSNTNVPVIENNFEGDPRAVQILLSQQVPITLIPVDLTLKYPLTQATEQQLMDSQTSAGELIKKWIANWREFTTLFPVDSPFREKVFLHDPLAAAYCYWPELFTCQEIKIKVMNTGEMVEDESGTAVTVCLEVDGEVVRRIENMLTL